MLKTRCDHYGEARAMPDEWPVGGQDAGQADLPTAWGFVLGEYPPEEERGRQRQHGQHDEGTAPL
jgi:hypothetical protein